ncbi:MAG: four helix bundle protein [Bacteroidetes bacterium]|nr:four helix bundle protein [Bacteroidota bacterium]
MNNFKELKVWQKAVEFSVLVYKSVEKFPEKEKFGIISQMTRSAVSIASNIAEGAGRNTNKDFGRFLAIALGSSFEIETQLAIANKIGYLNDIAYEKLNNELTEIQKMIYGLQKYNKI